MRIMRRFHSPLKKKARRGFRGYPVATLAFYGPDDARATKVAVGIIPSEHAEPVALERWWTEQGDVRTDAAIAQEILRFIQRHGVKLVVMSDLIIGCPHEEGVDYPLGHACPRCPFWAHRDRWTGDMPRSNGRVPEGRPLLPTQEPINVMLLTRPDDADSQDPPPQD